MEMIKLAIADWMRNKHDLDVRKVESFEEDIESSGGCETCAFDEIVMRIHYIDNSGDSRTYKHYGKFVELINELT